MSVMQESRSPGSTRWRFTACSTSRRSLSSAASPTRPPTSPAKPPKARPDAKPDEPTNANSPTGSSDERGATKPPDNSPTH